MRTPCLGPQYQLKKSSCWLDHNYALLIAAHHYVHVYATNEKNTPIHNSYSLPEKKSKKCTGSGKGGAISHPLCFPRSFPH